MMKKMYMLGMILLISQVAVSQFSHSFNLEKGEIRDMQNATDLVERELLTDLAGTTLPIGFDFQFGENVVADHLRFSADAVLEAYNKSQQEYETMFELSPMHSMDLVDRGTSSEIKESRVSYSLLGSEGSFILVIEWANVGFQKEYQNYQTTNNYMNFQMALVQDGNKIEYTYGMSRIIDPEAYFGAGGPCVGYESDKLKSRLYLENHAGNPSASAELGNMDTFPPVNANYTFRPETARPIVDELTKIAVGTKLDAKIYPNPCANEFKLILHGAPAGAKVLLRSPYGKVVFEGQVDRMRSFDLAGLDSGLYHIQIKTDTDVVVKKVMKR
ncbi:MAG: hypothetical protein ACI8XB_000082 [Patiriisocius sp.]|jgi:hypothetical protein